VSELSFIAMSRERADRAAFSDIPGANGGTILLNTSTRETAHATGARMTKQVVETAFSGRVRRVEVSITAQRK
jgi:hypothetical protein